MKKETNVLFIVPPSIPIEDLKTSDTPVKQWATNSSPPLGLLSIAAYAEKYAQVNFKLLDINVQFLKHKEEFFEWGKFINKLLLNST